MLIPETQFSLPPTDFNMTDIHWLHLDQSLDRKETLSYSPVLKGLTSQGLCWDSSTFCTFCISSLFKLWLAWAKIHRLEPFISDWIYHHISDKKLLWIEAETQITWGSPCETPSSVTSDHNFNSGAFVLPTYLKLLSCKYKCLFMVLIVSLVKLSLFTVS